VLVNYNKTKSASLIDFVPDCWYAFTTRRAYQQITMQINCGYYNPQNANGGVATSTEPFAFASSTCETVAYSTSTATDTIGTINGMTFDGVISNTLLFFIVSAVFYMIITNTKK